MAKQNNVSDDNLRSSLLDVSADISVVLTKKASKLRAKIAEWCFLCKLFQRIGIFSAQTGTCIRIVDSIRTSDDDFVHACTNGIEGVLELGQHAS